MINTSDFLNVLKILEKHFDSWNPPVIEMMKRSKESPYRVLITTLLSLRSRDERTVIAATELFKLADTPKAMLKLKPSQIEKAIFSIGFYEKKTNTILSISQDLIERFEGNVPETREELLSLNGVGIKTANLILAACFNKPYICVDIHVHRISNRLGFIKTTTAEQTEKVLSQKIKDKSWWTKVNYLLVGFGQTICKSTSPFCSKCVVYSFCERVGVTKSR